MTSLAFDAPVDDPGRRARVEELFPELASISDEHLRDVVTLIWLEFWAAGPWDDLAEIPKNESAPRAPSRVPGAWTLVTHSRAVAVMAVQTAESMRELHGLPYDRDALLALALLHDVSKVVEYEGTASETVKSRTGQLIQHGVLGAARMLAHGLPVELVHAVVAHTPTSNTFPKTHEALILRYIDFLDTDAMLLDAGEKLYLS